MTFYIILNDVSSNMSYYTLFVSKIWYSFVNFSIIGKIIFLLNYKSKFLPKKKLKRKKIK